MKLSEQRRFEKWRHGAYSVGTRVEVRREDWDKIKIRDKEQLGYGRTRYVAFKREVDDYLDTCLCRVGEHWHGDATYFYFFHAQDAVQFKLQFL